MNNDLFEHLRDFVSTVEDYVLSMYGDDIESLLEDVKDLDYEVEQIKRYIEDLEADMEKE